MITTKMLKNANKVAYLVEQYPEHKISQTIALLAMPSIEINTAIWAATELNFITAPDKATEKVALATPPETWQFGHEVEDLRETLLYSFEQIAKKEIDLEEYQLSEWTSGYPSHDIIIAMKLLLNGNQLHEYVLEDGENNYTFYTLYENRDKLWGRKAFKKDPLTGEDNHPEAEQEAEPETEQKPQQDSQPE